MDDLRQQLLGTVNKLADSLGTYGNMPIISIPTLVDAILPIVEQRVAAAHDAALGKTAVQPDIDNKPEEQQRAILFVDGNCGCALLGENIQDGEAEFVEIDYKGDDSIYYAEQRACFRALNKLRKRLGYWFSYAWK